MALGSNALKPLVAAIDAAIKRRYGKNWADYFVRSVQADIIDAQVLHMVASWARPGQPPIDGQDVLDLARAARNALLQDDD